MPKIPCPLRRCEFYDDRALCRDARRTFRLISTLPRSAGALITIDLFYEQLSRRARRIYLFRNEYIFELEKAAVVETPQLGHATYIFAKPRTMESFLAVYTKLTKRRRRKDSAGAVAPRQQQNHAGYLHSGHVAGEAAGAEQSGQDDSA